MFRKNIFWGSTFAHWLELRVMLLYVWISSKNSAALQTQIMFDSDTITVPVDSTASVSIEPADKEQAKKKSIKSKKQSSARVSRPRKWNY